MRTSWLLVSIAVHGAAIGAAIGFGVYSSCRPPIALAELRLQSQIASVPSVVREVPLPDVVAEEVESEALVEELAVDEVEVSDASAADPVEAATSPATTEAAALAAVKLTPSPSEILQQATTTRVRREVVEPITPEADQQAQVQPQVAAPSQVYVKAQRSDNQPPTYPSKERRLGREGKVLVRVSLDVAGNVARAWLLEPSRYPGFNRSALEAARNWQFQPATLDGMAVASETDIEVVFCLTND